MDKYLQRAIAEYERNIESGKSFYMDAPVLMEIEEYYEKQGKDFEAEQIMRFAEKLHPNSVDVLIVKAYRLRDRGKWNEAFAILADISDQENRDVQLFLAEWDAAEGRPEMAEKRVESNIAALVDDERWDWYLDLGEILLDYGFINRAIKYLSLIPSDYTFGHRVYELLADAYYQIQEYDKSIAAAEKLIDTAPYDAVSWSQLADIQQKCGHYEDCINSCDYALAIDDNIQQAMSLKLFATFALDRTSEGFVLCKEFMNRLPNNYSIRMYAGEQLCTKEDYATALQYLQEALRLCPVENPDRTRIVHDLTYIYIMQHKPEQALEIMISLCMTGTSRVDVYFQLVNSFLEYNLQEAAVRLCNEFCSFPEATDEDFEKITSLLVLYNQYKQARDVWQKIFMKFISGAETAEMNTNMALAARALGNDNMALFFHSMAQQLSAFSLSRNKQQKPNRKSSTNTTDTDEPFTFTE